MEENKRTIIVGSDHAGFKLKEAIKTHLESLNKYNVIDVGTYSTVSCDFPDYAEKLCDEVLKNEENRGVVICGSGIGVPICCNKRSGIRCALVHDTLSAKLSREHTDCNVMAMGEFFIGENLGKNIVDSFLSYDLIKEEKYIRRKNKIVAIEEKYCKK
jgi:ribose 5-phosphate isomerase B